MVNFPCPCPEFPISVHTTSKAPWASFSHLLATVLHNGEARGRQSAFDFLHTPPPPSNVGGATPACLCGSAHQHWMGVGGSGVMIRSDSIASICQRFRFWLVLKMKFTFLWFMFRSRFPVPVCLRPDRQEKPLRVLLIVQYR